MSRPTMQDVADRAGVSRALVSLVMNDSPKVSERSRRAVLRAARDLGYRPNLMARNLAQQRTRTLGVLVNDLQNPFFPEVIAGIEQQADEHDFRVVVHNGQRNPERELTAVENLLQFQVEALVLVGPRIEDDRLEEIGRVIPTVVVASGVDHPGVDTIVTDDRAGGVLAVEHLAELGHERIVHIDGARNISARQRAAGYIEGMRRAGLSDNIDIRTGGDTESDAFDVVTEILAGPDEPTAIFAFNDLLAAGVLDKLHDSGRAVPTEMSLVGYDNIFIAGLRHMSLTTVDQPRTEMGRLAVDTVIDRIENDRLDPTHQLLAPRLVARNSTSGPT